MASEQQETGIQIDQPVVTMTARATDKLKEVIAKQGRADLALRVYVTPGGCSGFSYGMTFAEGREQDDMLVEANGVSIVVDPMSAMYLKGSEIDFVDALMVGGFALRNPNAVSSCGCGQSFKTAEQSGTAKACHHYATHARDTRGRHLPSSFLFALVSWCEARAGRHRHDRGLRARGRGSLLRTDDGRDHPRDPK
jgi:iron-sulfur cluster assembly protein